MKKEEYERTIFYILEELPSTKADMALLIRAIILLAEVIHDKRL